MNYWQHGDVILKKVEEIPEGLVEAGHNVIQEGESTGHAHRLHTGIFTLLMDPKTKERTHLRVVEPSALRHEEHKEIMIPPGLYKIEIVREYDHFKEEARRVVD